MADDDNLPSDACEKVKCKYCKGNVITWVKCSKCEDQFHPSCLAQSARSKNAACKHELANYQVTNSEVSDESSSTTNNLEVENTLLWKLVHQLESKCAILEENCGLLKEKIVRLESTPIQGPHNKKLAVRPPQTTSFAAVASNNHRKRNNSNATSASSSSSAKSHRVSMEQATGTSTNLTMVTTESGAVFDSSVKGVFCGSASDSSHKQQHQTRTTGINMPQQSSYGEDPQISLQDVNLAVLQAHSAAKMHEMVHLTDNSQKGNDWQVVAKHNRRNRRFVVGDNSESADVQAVPKLVSLHVTRLDPKTQVASLKRLLVDKFPEVECEEHSSKYPDLYKSMKVTIRQENLKNAWRRDIWPNGAVISRFFPKRRMPPLVKDPLSSKAP